MNPRKALGLALITLLACGCAGPSDRLEVTGAVIDEAERVVLPALPLPQVNIDAGFPSTQPQADTPGVGSWVGLGSSFTITRVLVAQGDYVRAGQPIAEIDDRMPKAQLAAAKADAGVARAQVGLLAAAIDKAGNAASDLAAMKRKLTKAIDQLVRTRAKLRKARAEILVNLPTTEQALDQVNRQIEAIIGGGGAPSPALLAQQKQLRDAVAKMKAGLKTANAALPKIERGLAKARAGVRRLNTAAGNLADARVQLSDLKELAKIAAKAAEVPVSLARVQLSWTRLTAPIDGLVIEVVSAGERLAPGATVARLRASGASRIRAWLSPTQLNRVCLGDPAQIRADWLTGEVPGSLTRLGEAAVYPPTWVATDEVHLSRALTIEVTASKELPAGLPVDLSITGCLTAANQPDPNR